MAGIDSNQSAARQLPPDY